MHLQETIKTHIKIDQDQFKLVQIKNDFVFILEIFTHFYRK